MADVEQLTLQVQDLLQRMSCLEECNQWKDQEITRLRTDVENLRKRSSDCGGNASLESYSRSANTAINSALSTASSIEDSYNTDCENSESLLMKMKANHFQQLHERVTRLEGLVNADGRTKAGVAGAIQSPDSEAMSCQAKGPDSDVVSRLDRLQDTVDLLTNKVSSVEKAKKTFDACVKRFEVTLKDNQEQMSVLNQSLTVSDEKVRVLCEFIDIFKAEMDSLTHRVSSSESANKTFDSRLSHSEGKAVRFDETLNETTKQMDSLTLKVSSIEGVNRVFDSHLRDSIKKSLRLEDTLKEITKHQAEVKGDVENEKQWRDTMAKASFHVKLIPGTELNPDVNVQLDRCEVVRHGEHCFDRNTALFTAPVDGIYLLSLVVCQHNYGKVQVAVGPDNGSWYFMVRTYVTATGYYVGTTRDTRCGSVLMRLAQGQRVGVFANCLKGRCEVEWCHFSGCLISSCTMPCPETWEEIFAYEC